LTKNQTHDIFEADKLHPPTWDGADAIFETTKSDEFFNTLSEWETKY
jgi:hypothetical protein